MKLRFFALLSSVMGAFTGNAQEKDAFYFSKTLALNMDDTYQKVVDALKTEQFGVITDIPMDQKIKDKVPDAKLKPYRILGVCNPKFAYETLKLEENIGLFLPCKVVLKSIDANTTEVVMINPSTMMKMLGNDALNQVAGEVTTRFRRALENL
ncbi:MAG: hypothetical protein CVU09_13265 [Bacteroidetes bacterium HGW-Bacteroidetes-4]|jgi:uncharacterized protein (DUF302 family)|nr:MAG: hypothetical protein CVU09_13265 [Bacteroidetes bacterium HGW-Bacteroidetes-4]